LASGTQARRHGSIDLHNALKSSGTSPKFPDRFGVAEIARGSVTRAAECDGIKVATRKTFAHTESFSV
jgi:hypothetical protein